VLVADEPSLEVLHPEADHRRSAALPLGVAHVQLHGVVLAGRRDPIDAVEVALEGDLEQLDLFFEIVECFDAQPDRLGLVRARQRRDASRRWPGKKRCRLRLGSSSRL
jgi:hypothetical protein